MIRREVPHSHLDRATYLKDKMNLLNIPEQDDLITTDSAKGFHNDVWGSPL